MKKILFLITLTIISCAISLNENQSKEDLELLLKGFDFSMIETIWNSIKEYVDKAISFLKNIGLYEPMIEILEKYGKPLAILYCTSLTIPEFICSSIVDFLLEYIKKLSN